MATSTLIADIRGKNEIVLDKVPYIQYLIWFQKGGKKVTRALINSDSELNAMILAYPKQLGIQIRPINVRAQKINGSSVETFRIVIAGFKVIDKLGKVKFF